MKKTLKIIALSLLGVILLAVIGVTVVLGTLSSSGRMTELANKYARDYLPFKTEIGNVDLVFMKTFPRVSLQIENVTVVNPEYAAADTIADIGNIFAAIDLREFLSSGAVVSDRILLQDVKAELHVDSTGMTNLGMSFAAETEQPNQEPFSLPFDPIDLQKVSMERISLSYTDLRTGMKAEVEELGMDLKGLLTAESLAADKFAVWSGPISFHDAAQGLAAELVGAKLEVKGRTDKTSGEVKAEIKLDGATFAMTGTEYVHNISAEATIPVKADWSGNRYDLSGTSLTVAGLTLSLDGTAAVDGQRITTDLAFAGSDWRIGDLLSLVPEAYESYLEGVEAEGVMEFAGTAKGVIDSTGMPLITLDASLDEGRAAYPAMLPFPLNDLQLKLTAAIDPNDMSAGSVKIEQLNVATPESRLRATGLVQSPLGDMLCRIDGNLALSLSEITPFIPDTMDVKVTGALAGDIKARFRMSDIERGRYEKIFLDGTLTTDKLAARYDTIEMNMAGGKVHLQLPASSEGSFASVAVAADSLNIGAGAASVAVAAAELSANTAAFPDLAKHNDIKADFRFGTIDADCDTIVASARALGGELALSGVLADTTSLSDASVALRADAFSVAACDTLSLAMTDVELQAENITGEDRQHPTIKLQFDQSEMRASMGSQSALLGRTGIKADLEGDLTRKELMLQWTPAGYVNVKNATVKIDAVPDAIIIPDIDFVFTPEEYTINRSSMTIDRSDFALSGTLRNVNSYLKGDSLLRGELKFISTVTDVNYFMELFSGLGSEVEGGDVEYAPDEVTISLGDIRPEVEEAPEEVTTPQLSDLMNKEPSEDEESGAGPFIVPKGISLVLDTRIDNALIGTNVARNVNGAVTVNDGVLVLDALNFTSSAADVQLTAMYKSPRRDHLYVGLDYHMTNVEIGNLLSTFPDLGDMMPMLNSFGGTGEFHMAVETNLDSLYNLKKSTLRGAASIVGNDLVVMDGDTFSTIARKLNFSKQAENKIDSLSVEFTVFRNEIDIYPFLIVMDRYKAIVGGRHNLDMSMNYNISMLQNAFLPIKLGVDIYGTPEKMRFRLRRSRYDSDYRPVGRKSLEASQINLRNMIHESLSSGVIRTGVPLVSEEPEQ